MLVAALSPGFTLSQLVLRLLLLLFGFLPPALYHLQPHLVHLLQKPMQPWIPLAQPFGVRQVSLHRQSLGSILHQLAELSLALQLKLFHALLNREWLADLDVVFQCCRFRFFSHLKQG